MTDTSLHLNTPFAAADLETILQAAVELAASDVHLKVGRPPIVRLDGELEPLPGFATFGAPQLNDIVNRVCAVSRSRRETFELTGELDTAFQPAGLPRFRVNAFRQPGDTLVAFRIIPRTVPDFQSLRLPPTVEAPPEDHRG